MANTKSAIKRIRRISKQTTVNKARKNRNKNAIKNKLNKFDPGVQGEHKIKRGFKPTITYSAHWISEPNFKDAIENFVNNEEQHIKAYVKATSKYLPFKSI